MKSWKSLSTGVAGAVCLALASSVALAGTAYAEQDADIKINSVTYESETEIRLNVTYRCTPYVEEEDDPWNPTGPIDTLTVETRTDEGFQHGKTKPVCDGRSHNIDINTHDFEVTHKRGKWVVAEASLTSALYVHAGDQMVTTL